MGGAIIRAWRAGLEVVLGTRCALPPAPPPAPRKREMHPRSSALRQLSSN